MDTSKLIPPDSAVSSERSKLRIDFLTDPVGALERGPMEGRHA